MPAVDLYWIPLGAGGHSVRWNGRVFEALAAAAARRPRRDLYHAGLTVETGGEHFAIELAPVPDRDGNGRGAVAGGAVGSRLAGRLRIFRYELRCARDRPIPDLADAVGGPLRVSDDGTVAARVVELAPEVPPCTWGRDEAGAGEMWTSNSAISWLLTAAGIDLGEISPPRGGGAPGWRAGIDTARSTGQREPARWLRAHTRFSADICGWRAVERGLPWPGTPPAERNPPMSASTALRPRRSPEPGSPAARTPLAVQDVAYWVIVASIYLAFGFLWYYSAKEKLIDDGGTMPTGLAKAFSGSFIDSFPGLDASWVILGIVEAIAFLAFLASIVAGEFLPNRPKPILTGALAISLLTFAALIFGQQMIAEFDSVAQLFGYFGATVVTLLLVLVLPPRPGLDRPLGD